MKQILLLLFIYISPSIFAQPNLTLDSIVVVTSNDTVYVWDYNAWEQCVFTLDYTVDVVDSVITITQIDTAEGATTCYGYHNFVVPIVGLTEGYYRIDIFRDCLYEEIKFITSFQFEYTFSDVEFISNSLSNFWLSNAYPNPFNSTTVINYTIPFTGNVAIKVYDVLGNEVTTLVNEEKSAGEYQIDFNANNLSSGVYIYKIQTDGFVSSKKMILLK